MGARKKTSAATPARSEEPKTGRPETPEHDPDAVTTRAEKPVTAESETAAGPRSGSPDASDAQPAGMSTRLLTFIGSLVAAAWAAFVSAFARVFVFAERWLFGSKKALYGMAVTRILLGVTALGLLASNFGTRLYTFGSGSAWNGEMAEPVSDFPSIWIFSAFHSVMGNDVLYTVMYLVLAALAALFTVGWRFRLVHPVFFCLWVGFIEANDMVGDQGDNMYRIVLLLLFFADPAARWSVDARRRAKREWFEPGGSLNQIGTVLHNLALVALTAQVCFVYVSGALYKAGGTPWAEGYAVYNPLQTARFGTWPILSDLVTAWGPMVTMFGWGSIILQMAFPFLLLTRPTRLIGLAGILSFHVGIAVLMGLPWFSLTMIAVDSIFIRDRSWRRLSRGVATRWRAARQAPPVAPASAASGPDPAAETDAHPEGSAPGTGVAAEDRR